MNFKYVINYCVNIAHDIQCLYYQLEIISLVSGGMFAAAGPSPVPIPYQMTMAASQKMKQPVLVNVDKGDSARVQTVKSLINKMVVYDPKKRLSAAEVVDTMESVAGEIHRNFVSNDCSCARCIIIDNQTTIADM